MLPREGRRHEAYFIDSGIMSALDMDEKVNLSAIMIKHTRRVISLRTGPHSLAYGYLLTLVFKSFGIPLKYGK